MHQLRIVGGRPAKMIADAPEQRGEIVFSHAQFVVMIRRRDFTTGFQAILIHLFENRLLWCRGFGFWISSFELRSGRFGFGCALDRFSMGDSSGAEFRRWRRGIGLLAELLDLGF